MADTRIEFKYDISDVTSAQRSRFLHARQFKLILGFWAISTALMALSILFPDAFPLFVDITWAMVGQVALIYFGTLAVILVVVPWISFNFNRFWRLPLVFQFNPKHLRLSVADKPGGLRLTWDQIRRVEGTDRVYLIYYDDLQKHFILPRSAFKEHQEKRFHQLLARYAPQSGAAKAPPQDEAPSQSDGGPSQADGGPSQADGGPSQADGGPSQARRKPGRPRKTASPAKAAPPETEPEADDGFEVDVDAEEPGAPPASQEKP